MSLTIVVSKSDVSEKVLCEAQCCNLFKKVIERETELHFVLMPGKLTEILKYFNEEAIPYKITNSLHGFDIHDHIR